MENSKPKTRLKIFGDNLKRIRAERGITRKQLADIIGVSLDSIAGYENGKYSAPLEKIFALAEYLNVSIVSLTGDIGNFEKPFNYKLKHALNTATIAGYSPILRESGSVLIEVADPWSINKDTGTVTRWSTEYTFDTQEEFIKFIDIAETQALGRQITFDAAFRLLLKGAHK